MAFPLPRELNPIEAIRKELKRIEAQRFIHPQYDPELKGFWVGFVWDDGSMRDHPTFADAKPKRPKWYPIECEHGFDACPKCDAACFSGRWLLAGFFRKPRHWTAKSIRKIRRRMRIPKGATLHMTELWRGTSAIPVEPPKRRVFTTAPDKVKKESLEVRDLGPKRGRRFKAQPSGTGAFGKNVKYVVLGRLRAAKHADITQLYLGPLMADQLRDAKKEAREMFGGMYKLTLVPLEHVDTKFRRKLRSGYYRPGGSILPIEKLGATVDA